MKTKKVLIFLFALVVLAQLYVPAKMIFDYEVIFKNGTELKLKVEPMDPSDPFHGKYIDLSYTEQEFEVENPQDFTREEKIYVLFDTDKNGFAQIDTIVKDKPDAGIFVQAKVKYSVNQNDFGNPKNKRIGIDYSFKRFYMEESKAAQAEELYRESTRDTNQVAYAIVNVLNGKGIVKNVMINGKPIKDLVKDSKQ